MDIKIYVALFLSVILSGISVLFVNITGKNLKLVLSFSGAYLFAISVLHLIPEIYSSTTENIGLYILIGFFMQILFEFFTEGIEHRGIYMFTHMENILHFHGQ